MVRLEETLSEDVGWVIAGRNVCDRDLIFGHEFTDFEVTTSDVPRTIARAPILGQFDRAGIVDVQGGGTLLDQTETRKKSSNEHDLEPSRRQ